MYRSLTIRRKRTEEALSALLRQYYVNRSNWPKTILLPFEPEDKEDIERWLSDMAGRRVYLEVPQRGDPRPLCGKRQQ